MKLKDLLSGSNGILYGNGDVDVKGIAVDSRKVKDGFIFFAIKGMHVDGNNYIDQAINSGACVVVSAQYLHDLSCALFLAELSEVISGVAAKFYNYPDSQLLLFGVTGTNGKTTITYFLESILNVSDLSTGVVGTVNYRYAKKTFDSPNTTPQAAELYEILAKMVSEHQLAAVIEVSSHALSLGRVNGIEFDTAIFTNLTRDHLDFHKTMDDYFYAKTKLFSGLVQKRKNKKKIAVINIDDPYGKKMLDVVGAGAQKVTYGIKNNALVSAQEIIKSAKHTSFLLKSDFGTLLIILNFIGEHNIYNALAAAAAALYNGIPIENVKRGLEGLNSVPGRLEKVDLGQAFNVVVDYAHTDDALKNVLTSLKPLTSGKLITVFGCGGDRDRTKRPIMGAVATELSDYVIVTSDNPRSEDPRNIALDIEVGIKRTKRENYKVVLDRKDAILEALSMAASGDVILLAGKGHETYQIVGNNKIHFSDFEVAKLGLESLRKTGKSL